jgi:hypothetical protein
MTSKSIDKDPASTRASVVNVAVADTMFQLDSTAVGKAQTTAMPLTSLPTPQRATQSVSTMTSKIVTDIDKARQQSLTPTDYDGCCLGNQSRSSSLLVDSDKSHVVNGCLDNDEWSATVGPVMTSLTSPLSSLHFNHSPPADASNSGKQPSSGSGSIIEDLGHFRASFDASRLHCCGGFSGDGLQPLRRVRSKSVLIQPTTARLIAKHSPRGSLQTDVGRHKMSMAEVVNALQLTSSPLSPAAVPTQAKSVQTYVSYVVGERLRSASLATTKSHTHSTGKESTISDMCLEYMRLNGAIPLHFRSRSLQSQHNQDVNR